MRFRVASLRRAVKGDLTIELVPQALTSYGGLELLGRYLRRIDLDARLRQAFTGSAATTAVRGSRWSAASEVGTCSA